MSNRITSLVIFFALPMILLGQSVQDEYLEAKRLYKSSQYLSAKASFSNLSRSNSALAPYASFYYGLSAWNSGDQDVAIETWTQLLKQYPNFDQKAEVLFWLSYGSFSEGDFFDGIKYAKQHTEVSFNSSTENDLINKFAGNTTVDSVLLLLDRYPDSEVLAKIFVSKSMDLPYNERDFPLIDSLTDLHDLDVFRVADVRLPIEKKDEYQVAALLPFMYDSLENPGRILQNSLVIDLYQGMQLAAEDLKKEGINIKLKPYDSKRKKEVTDDILATEEFLTNDLIVGPFYSGPVKSAQDYSLEYKVNMINPVSSTSEIIGRNPFSFLFRPSTETIAHALADQAIMDMDSNKYVMIFHEQYNQKDSILASIYAERLKEAGFDIVWSVPINQENAKAIQDSLTAEHIVYMTKDEADSISEIPDRIIESRRVRDDELERIYAEKGEENAFTLPIEWENRKAFVYYEEVLDMAKDSIGHFLVATHRSVFSNALISVVQARNDSTRIYTYADWLQYTMADYSQYERLGITMADPTFIDKERYTYQEIANKLGQEFLFTPSEFHFLGYELMYFVGRQMNAYGKYFQVGLRDGQYTRGRIFEGSEYGESNDNQVVPIIRFKDTKLEVVNRDSYGY